MSRPHHNNSGLSKIFDRKLKVWGVVSKGGAVQIL